MPFSEHGTLSPYWSPKTSTDPSKRISLNVSPEAVSAEVDPGPPLRTTNVNGTLEPGPQACNCSRSFQRCRFTVNLDAGDPARDVHGINRELATTIAGWHSRDKGQTLEAPGDRLPLPFGVERDGRNHREKAPSVSRPALDNPCRRREREP